MKFAWASWLTVIAAAGVVQALVDYSARSGIAFIVALVAGVVANDFDTRAKLAKGWCPTCERAHDGRGGA